MKYFYLLSLSFFAFSIGMPLPANALNQGTFIQQQNEIQSESAQESEDARCPEDFNRGCTTCKVKTKEENTRFGKCVDENQLCGGERINYSCCICEQTALNTRAQTLVANSGHTFESCQEKCKALAVPGEVYRQLGVGVFGPSQTNAGPTPEAIHQQNMLCFSPAECASEEYGKSTEAFRSGFGCPSGKGRCVAPEPNIELAVGVGGVSTVTGLRGYIAVMFRFIVSIVSLVAAIMFMYGGVRYIFGSAYQDIGRAKEIMIDSLVGLAITLGAMVILNAVNPATTNLKKLEVYLINKQQILSSRFCADVQSTKEILFGDAGFSPAYKDVNKVTFSVAKEKTRCNYEYYAKGFGTDRCAGTACDPGFVCLNCESGLCKAGADPKGYGCVKSTFGGNITFTDDRTVKELALYAICGNAVKNTVAEAKAGLALASFYRVEEATLQQKETSSGQQAYSFALDIKDIADATAKCSSKGNLFGFAMGMVYSVPGIVSGDNNEAAVLGKSNCGGGRFAGYHAYETETAAALAPRPLPRLMLDRAMICGLLGSLKTSTNVWTLTDIANTKGTEGGTPQSIICNFEMNSGNAERNIAGSLAVEVSSLNVNNLHIYCP